MNLNLMTSTELKSFDLRDKKNALAYTDYLDQIDPLNPFFRLELTMNLQKEDHLPYFLVYFSDGEPLILLPFYLRPVKLEDHPEPYYDVISPYGYSGPVYNKDLSEEHLHAFWHSVDEWYSTHNVVSEFIRFSLNENYLGYTGTLNHTLYNVKGKIIDKDSLWFNFKKKVRNNYRKSQQFGIEFQVFDHTSITRKEIEDFHRIYTSTMVRNEASDLYFFTIAYFENFILNNPEHCLLSFVTQEGVPISTELVLIFDKTLYSFLGGTLSEYFPTRPNDFLKINMMEWAMDHDKEFYVLGGGRSDGDGLYSYKKAFFPNDEDVVYYTGRKITNPEVYRKLVLAADPATTEEDIFDLDAYFPKYREIKGSYLKP